MPRRGIAGASFTIWPTFSASVMRRTRSRTRSSTARAGSQAGIEAFELSRKLPPTQADTPGEQGGRAQPAT